MTGKVASVVVFHIGRYSILKTLRRGEHADGKKNFHQECGTELIRLGGEWEYSDCFLYCPKCNIHTDMSCSTTNPDYNWGEPYYKQKEYIELMKARDSQGKE